MNPKFPTTVTCTPFPAWCLLEPKHVPPKQNAASSEGDIVTKHHRPIAEVKPPFSQASTSCPLQHPVRVGGAARVLRHSWPDEPTAAEYDAPF